MMHQEDWIKTKYAQLPVEKRQSYAFLSLKLKHIRKLNHVHGRAYGDDFIRLAYEALEAKLKEGEVLAHVGSGCFNLLLKRPAETSDYALIEWATEVSKEVYLISDERFYRNSFCGIGIYLLEEEPVDFDTAQYYADVCRHNSTERDFLISHVEIYGTSYVEHGLYAPDYRSMLESAIKQGHIKMYLQPKVDLSDGSVSDAEALMRWIDPVLGELSIADYVPILEECGQMNLVDRFIFEEACKWIHRWKKEYAMDMRISVNLSKNTFVYPFFMKEFQEIFERYECPKSSIELELLESIILNQLERVKEVANEIITYGFRCSLDDFGSGYASYNVLTNTPLHTLKIDRSLLLDDTNEKERLMLKHIIAFAHELGLHVVAEGVEKKPYVTYLKELGCDDIQGFIFYRPMPVEEFEQRFIIEKQKAIIE